MFDSKQDIGLLHGSLLSAAYSNANLVECTNMKNAVHIICDSVKLIIHHTLTGVKNAKEKVEIQLHINEKLHAAIFFNTLRSHGIKSKTADEFYDSILYNWPSIDLKFYIELSFKCDWSEYFIMCALQLPSEVLFTVLKMILNISFTSDVEYYSWHLVLQTLILKLLKVTYDIEVQYPFDFDFSVESDSFFFKKESSDKFSQIESKTFEKYNNVDEKTNEINAINSETSDKYNTDKSDTITNYCIEGVKKENDGLIPISNEITEHEDEDIEEENYCLVPFCYEHADNHDDDTIEIKNEELKSFKEMFNDVYDNISLKMKESKDIGGIKILLHAAKTLLKYFILEKKKDGAEILKFRFFFQISNLLEEYIESDTNKEKLKNEFKNCSSIFSSHSCVITSWNISLNYLIFLLGFYVEEAFPTIKSQMSLDNNDMFCSKIVSVIHSLEFMNYPFSKLEEHLLLLCKIIQFQFQGSSRAAKIFLADPIILEKNHSLIILDENCHVINLSQTYSLMVDNIMTPKSPESKLKLLKIMYKCLQRHKIDMYNTVVGYILSNYGFTEEFQLPNFHNQLSEFARQTPTLEEAEKIFPVLLVQNPMLTLKYLIDETLVQGLKGKIFIQLLKQFQHACFFMKNYGHICTLHEILNDYFNKTKLEVYESKNMVTLYRFLLEIHSETPIMLPCTFFRRCIVPKLYPEYDKLELLLECAHVLMPALLSDDAFLKASEYFINFIIKFGMLVNHLIVTGNGKIKSLVIPILNELENHQMKNRQINDEDKVKLWAIFKDLDEMTCVYFKEFLPDNIKLVSRSAVWINCCKKEDSSCFEEKFSIDNLTYLSLMTTLEEVLPHLTQKEWMYSINLAKMCCKNCKIRDEIIHSNNPFQLSGFELDTYAVIIAIVNCLHFILNQNIGSLYVSICFSNVLKNVLYQEEFSQTYILLSIVLEVCYLVSCIPPDLIHIYSAVLLELKKEISLKTDQSDCNKLLYDVIMSLQDSYKEKFSFFENKQ